MKEGFADLVSDLRPAKELVSVQSKQKHAGRTTQVVPRQQAQAL